jgi:VanZ family protein
VSGARRVGRWLVYAQLVPLWCGTLLALHVPGPSGFESPDTQRQVRGAWEGAGEVAQGIGALAPDAATRILEPLIDDKTIHFGLFFALALLYGVEAALGRRVRASWIAIIAVGLAVHAALGELLQSALGRIADPYDVVANALGVGCGLAVALTARALVRALRDRVKGSAVRAVITARR